METFQISDIISNGDFALQSRDTLSVLWAVTRACNFNCSYCTYSRDFKLADEVFSTKEDLLGAARKLLGLNRPGYQITLYGGEPTFHPNFLDLLTFLGESQAPISLRMFTNGSRSPGFFEQVFALSKGLPFGVIFSLHLERARFDNFKKVVEIAVNAGTSAGVSLMIDPKWREESKRYAEELLALCRKAPFFVNVVIPYAPGGIMGGECTAEDHVWIKQVREEFARISIPANLKSPFFTRIQSNVTLNRDGRPVSLAPEDSLQLLSKAETPSYRNFYCCGGTNVWFLAPDGTVSGGVCESARPLFNIFHDPLPEIVSKMAVVRCTAPACNSIENIPLPKFRNSEDAESCIADFQERAMAYYLTKPVRPELAMVDSKLHHPEAAEAALNRSLGLRPNDPAALKLLADSKRDDGFYQEAGIIYGELINQHPDQFEILLSLAKCFYKLGDREGVKAALEQVLALDPGNAIAQDNLAVIRAESRQCNGGQPTPPPAIYGLDPSREVLSQSGPPATATPKATPLLVTHKQDYRGDLPLIEMVDQYLNEKLHDAEFVAWKLATESSAYYINTHMHLARVFASKTASGRHDIESRNNLLAFALSACSTDGLVLEFGVHQAETTNFLAARLPSGGLIHGFDSFQGLPGNWFLGRRPGHFSVGGTLPQCRPEVILHPGWFSEVLPGFLAQNPGPFRFVHIDSDLYSSARDVLNLARSRFISGTIIVFDEYFNYPGWEQHEFRAFQEFVRDTKAQYEYIAMAPRHYSVAVRLLHV